MNELLKPRYKLILDYPGNTFQVGKVYECVDGKVWDMAEQHPKIFRKLEWWEERDFDLAGMCIRAGELDGAHSFYKLIKRLDPPSEDFWEMEGRNGAYTYPLYRTYPATIEEFENFTKPTQP